MKHFNQSLLDQVKRINPIPLLERYGYIVKQDGKSNYKVLKDNSTLARLTQRADGIWLWTGQTLNDNGDDCIRLLQVLLNLNFPNAVYLLLGENPQPKDQATPNTLPPMAQTPTRSPANLFLRTPDIETIHLIREYLHIERGISNATIQLAESQRFIQYVPNGVAFCGYDENHKLRNADFRAAFSFVTPQKRCYSGSDKRYPPILFGDKQSTKIWIVEGGMDALALRDIAIRQGQPVPLVIVSGGAGVSRFLETPHIQALLRQASKVTIALENEATSEIQTRTNSAHQKQMQLVSNLVSSHCEVTTYQPQHDKDLAALNLRVSR